MRLHPRAMPVAQASAKLGGLLAEYQSKHDLTDIEMFQAVTSWAQTHLKFMLREERHPDNPDKGADEE